MLKAGLYEQVINKDLSDKIDDSAQLIDKRNIDKAEAPQVLAGYLSEVIEKGLSRLAGDDIEGQLGLANRIVSAVTELTGDDEFDGLSVDERAEQLLAVANMQNNAYALRGRITMTRPDTSLASSSPKLINTLSTTLTAFSRECGRCYSSQYGRNHMKTAVSAICLKALGRLQNRL